MALNFKCSADLKVEMQYMRKGNRKNSKLE